MITSVTVNNGVADLTFVKLTQTGYRSKFAYNGNTSTNKLFVEIEHRPIKPSKKDKLMNGMNHYVSVLHTQIDSLGVDSTLRSSISWQTAEHAEFTDAEVKKDVLTAMNLLAGAANEDTGGIYASLMLNEA